MTGPASPSADPAAGSADGLPGVHADGGPRLDPRRDPAAYLRACAARYGDVFALTPDHVQVWDPALARQVLRREADFPLAPARVPSARTSIQEDAPERWRVARRYAWDHLAPRVVEGSRERLAERWGAELGERGRVFSDAAEVVDVTARVIWPELLADTGSDDALREVLSSTSRARQHLAGRRRPLALRRLRRRFDEVIGSLLETVAGRRARGPHEPPDLLDALLAGTDPALTDLEVAQTLAICLDSSMQTTGAGAAWLLTALEAHLDGFRAVLHERGAAEDFVTEALRLTPVIAALNRRSREAGRLGECPVGAGVEVVVAVEGMHLDVRRWSEDPAVFAPDRWRAERVHEAGAHLTYGAGPRTCLGMHLATLALVELVRTVADGRAVESASPAGIHRDNLNWPTGFPMTVRRA